MRRRLPVDDSSDESEHNKSDADGSVTSDTDLTDDETCSDKDGKMLDTFDEEEYTREDYTESSTRLLNRIENQWKECWTSLQRRDVASYKTVTIGTLLTFFTWLLDQRQGKDGRKRRGIKFASSLGTYWKVYRLVYERATGAKLDGKINRSMHRVLRTLAKEYGLLKIGRDKACMYVEDLTQVLETNLRTTEKRYSHGRHRILAQLYLQLGGFTANRPKALLSLCYRHIQVTLLRDPECGPHWVLLELTFEFTKQNTFPIPEVIHDETLLFSPHVFLLGMLFHDGAFAAYNLTSPEELSKLTISPERNELPLRLNRKLDNIPIFRKAERTSEGWVISENKQLPDSTLRPWIKALGEITGFAQVTRPYSLRYAGGKAFNENGNVSEAMQNLMMGHADIRTFVKHYLSRRITVDTQAVVRGIQPQNALMRAACTMSRSIDARRPRHLTREQSASVDDDPTVCSLLAQRERFKQRLRNATKHPRYQMLNRTINQARQRLRHALLQEIKERWKYEQPVRDVEQQLAGIEASDVAAVMKTRDAMLPVQKVLVDAVLAQPGTTLEEEVSRRNRAIRAVMDYCGIEEGGRSSSRRKRYSSRVVSPPDSQEDAQLKAYEEALEAAKVSVYDEKRPTICFVCLGNGSLPIIDRVRPFSNPGGLTKIFQRKHLANINEGEPVGCNLCQNNLVDKIHWQRHAIEIHGTVS
ncbi:hypothetical protein BDV95DRAFT_626203 [Massariosphaeria phaeospora]|uniref:C2H2 finger domain protein n=1 Tax=Massariosphaeria phaeospora TaxID=100035 RepID=A0A7C8IJD9_9PLEO|nr:hypothetical protein BDV95DRAFT_626203 [Massariosphaeria phaeospora]